MLIYPYRAGSASVKALRKALDAKIVRRERSKLKGNKNKTVLNWGCSVIDNPEVMKCNVVNHPDAVNLISDKLKFFKHVEGKKITPAFFTDKDNAINFINTTGNKIMCRTVLRGHSGEGIVIARSEEEVVDAPLYVVYQPKKEEFRIHVAGGKVFDVQRKARDLDRKDIDWQVRNHANGFIYQRHDIEVPEGVEEIAIKAMACFDGLYFGAVDVVWSEKNEKSFVLEINSAPGLVGSTLDNYVKMFGEIK